MLWVHLVPNPFHSRVVQYNTPRYLFVQCVRVLDVFQAKVPMLLTGVRTCCSLCVHILSICPTHTYTNTHSFSRNLTHSRALTPQVFCVRAPCFTSSHPPLLHVPRVGMLCSSVHSISPELSFVSRVRVCVREYLCL
jgi:hypothetical protein